MKDKEYNEIAEGLRDVIMNVMSGVNAKLRATAEQPEAGRLTFYFTLTDVSRDRSPRGGCFFGLSKINGALRSVHPFDMLRAELDPGIMTDGDESGALTIGINVYPLPFDAARWIKTDWGPSDGEFLGESAKND